MDAPVHIGRYRVCEVIARGGMGLVLRAEDPADGRLVAIKQIHAHLVEQPGVRARFLREGRIAESLRHPNIVAVLEVGTSGDVPYLAMEYVDGGTLADELARRPRGSIDRLLAVAGQTCAALACAHAAGIVHRDITPRNLLLTRDGTVKVADFGIARARDDTRLTLTGSVLGTVRYLAPEQAAGGTATPASDLYSLGVVMYELLAGRAPFEAESLAALVLLQQTQAPAPLGELRPDAPPAFVDAISACLARDPAARPASAAALAWQLGLGEIGATRVAAGPPPLEPTARLTSPALPPRRRRGIRLVAVTAASVLGVATLVFAVTHGGGAGSQPPVVHPAPTDPAPAVQARDLARWLRAQSG